MAAIPSTTSLKERIERIAALQQRGSPPHPESPPQPSTSMGGPKLSASAFRDKIARFEQKGGTPVPKSTFGLWAPAQTMKRNNELYGNRIPSVKEVPNRPKDPPSRPEFLAPSARRLRSVSASDALFTSQEETYRESERSQDSDLISSLHIEGRSPSSPSFLQIKPKSPPPILGVTPSTPLEDSRILRHSAETPTPDTLTTDSEDEDLRSANDGLLSSDFTNVEEASTSFPTPAENTLTIEAKKDAKLFTDEIQCNTEPKPKGESFDIKSTTPITPTKVVAKQDSLPSVSLSPVKQDIVPEPPKSIEGTRSMTGIHGPLGESPESPNAQKNVFSSRGTPRDCQDVIGSSLETPKDELGPSSTSTPPAELVVFTVANSALSHEKPNLDAFPIPPGHPPPVLGSSRVYTAGVVPSRAHTISGARFSGDRTSISSTHSTPSLTFSLASASSSTACSPTAISTNHIQQQPATQSNTSIQPIPRPGASLQRSKSHSRPKSYVPTWYDSDSDDGEAGWANVVVTRRYY